MTTRVVPVPDGSLPGRTVPGIGSQNGDRPVLALQLLPRIDGQPLAARVAEVLPCRRCGYEALRWQCLMVAHVHAKRDLGVWSAGMWRCVRCGDTPPRRELRAWASQLVAADQHGPTWEHEALHKLPEIASMCPHTEMRPRTEEPRLQRPGWDLGDGVDVLDVLMFASLVPNDRLNAQWIRCRRAEGDRVVEMLESASVLSEPGARPELWSLWWNRAYNAKKEREEAGEEIVDDPQLRLSSDHPYAPCSRELFPITGPGRIDPDQGAFSLAYMRAVVGA